MQGTCTTSHHHRKFSRIKPSFYGDFAYTLGHVGAGYPVHTGCCFFNRKPHGSGNMLFDRLTRQLDVQLHFATGKVFRIQVTQNYVGIRGGGQRAPLAIRGRARVGASTQRTHAQQTAFIQPAH